MKMTPSFPDFIINTRALNVADLVFRYTILAVAQDVVAPLFVYVIVQKIHIFGTLH